MTKEILKLLFETIFKEYQFKTIVDNTIHYTGSSGIIENIDCHYRINAFEFVMFYCKSYVVKNSGWTLQSYTNERDSGICRVKVGDGQEINKFIAPSEVEAIFNASEWIYTELKNKGKLK